MCEIFKSVRNLAKVAAEFGYLQQSARDLMNVGSNVRTSSFSWTSHEEWLESECACIWLSIAGDVFGDAGKKQKKIGRALLCMDLYREFPSKQNGGALEHAESSLLTCAFINGGEVTDKDYDPLYLRFDSNGWPREPDYFQRHCGGRLLRYSERNGSPFKSWRQSSWLFAVPASKLVSTETFIEEVAEPFWRIIDGSADTLVFREGSSACVLMPQ